MGIIARFLAPFYRRQMASLVRGRGPESARQRKVEQEAAADVEAVRQDEKYFDRDAPANEDELLSPSSSSRVNRLSSP